MPGPTRRPEDLRRLGAPGTWCTATPTSRRPTSGSARSRVRDDVRAGRGAGGTAGGLVDAAGRIVLDPDAAMDGWAVTDPGWRFATPPSTRPVENDVVMIERPC